MPIVTVQQGPRSPEAKRELIARITDALKVPAASVQVWINEIPPELGIRRRPPRRRHERVDATDR